MSTIKTALAAVELWTGRLLTLALVVGGLWVGADWLVSLLPSHLPAPGGMSWEFWFFIAVGVAYFRTDLTPAARLRG